jgi:hypothetical protein
MVQALPAPEVLRCYFEEAFEPHLPAMSLRWQEPTQSPAQVWQLPEGVSLTGPAPSRFGISIQRLADDSYAVRLLWDRTCLIWLALTRRQLIESAIAPLLAALGTDLWYLLDQPIDAHPTTFPHAA